MSSSARTNYPTKVPGIPKPPADASPAMRRYLENLAEAVEIRLGRRGDARDRAITYRDLINDGIIYERLSNAGNPTGGVSLVDPAKSSLVPPAPANFQVNGAYSKMLITWDYPPYYEHGYIEIYRHTVDQIGDATFLGTSTGSVYVDECGEGAAFYYWGRHVSVYDVRGPWNSVSGTYGETALDVELLLETLTGEITQDQFYQSLSDQIDLLDAAIPLSQLNTSITNANTAITNANNAIADAQTAIGDVENDIVSLQSITDTNTTNITNLNTTVGDNSSDITTLQSTTANNALDITGLQTTVNDPTTGVAANATAISGLDSTVTQQGNTLTSHAGYIIALENTVNDSTTGVAANAIAISGLNSTVTSQGTTLTSHASDITNLQTAVGDNASGLIYDVNTITTDVNTLTGDVSSIASSVSTISTTVGSNTTSIQQNTTSINGIEGEYSVRIDSNGYVAGFGLINGGSGSSAFYVRADKFAIASPGQNSIIPFTVVTTPYTASNGVSVPAGTYIDAAYIKAATITAAKIGSVNADTITSGFIASARIDTNTIKANQIDIDNVTLVANGNSLQIGVVDTGNIEDDAITTTKIGNAQVQTLQIAGQAVTIPAGTTGTQNASITYSTSGWTTVATLSINNGTNASTMPSAIFVQGYLNFHATTYGTTNSQPVLRIEDGTGTGWQSGTTSRVGYSSALSVVGSFQATSGIQTFYLKARNEVATAGYTVKANGLFVQGIRR